MVVTEAAKVLPVAQPIVVRQSVVLLGADPADSRDHFYTEIVDALRLHGAEVQSDIEELWRGMAFFVSRGRMLALSRMACSSSACSSN